MHKKYTSALGCLLIAIAGQGISKEAYASLPPLLKKELCIKNPKKQKSSLSSPEKELKLKRFLLENIQKRIYKIDPDRIHVIEKWLGELYFYPHLNKKDRKVIRSLLKILDQRSKEKKQPKEISPPKIKHKIPKEREKPRIYPVEPRPPAAKKESAAKEISS